MPVSAAGWVSDLTDAIRAYSQARRAAPPVVMRAASYDADVLVTLDCYPEEPENLLTSNESTRAGNRRGPARRAKHSSFILPRSSWSSFFTNSLGEAT
jgi:hypothetical protein